MKCENCDYKKIREIPDDHAYDTEHRRFHDKEIDFCEEHLIPCDEAYLTCPYREIMVEAQHIQHVINLLRSMNYTHYTRLAIDHLKKILKGEIE